MTLHEQLGRLDTARELRGSPTEPAQMRAAGPAKVGELRLGFSIRHRRSVLHDLYRVAPLLVQQALYWDEAMPELPNCFPISVGGGVLQGDLYRIEISVSEGACALVHTQSANSIHQMDANYASQHQAIDVAPGAYLEYFPDFTIPYRGSRFITQTDAVVAPDAPLLYGEMALAGPKHHHVEERIGFDPLSMAVAVRRPDGRKLFSEKRLVGRDDGMIDLAAVMRGFDAFANLMWVTPPDVAVHITERFGTSLGMDSPRAISGVSRLPNAASLLLRAVGVESCDVRRDVRRFWRIVREEVGGRTLPEVSFWR